MVYASKIRPCEQKSGSWGEGLAHRRWKRFSLFLDVCWPGERLLPRFYCVASFLCSCVRISLFSWGGPSPNPTPLRQTARRCRRTARTTTCTSLGKPITSAMSSFLEVGSPTERTGLFQGDPPLAASRAPKFRLRLQPGNPPLTPRTPVSATAKVSCFCMSLV